MVDKPGNVTIIENGGCNEQTFSIGEQYDVVWMWDPAVADLNGDGNDDIVTLELLADIKISELSPTWAQLLHLLKPK